MGSQYIVVQKENHIGLLTINRPEKRNALDTPTWNELIAAIRDFRNDDDVRVIIITGAGGKVFAAGADIGELNKRPALNTLKGVVQGHLLEIENLEKPVIAAIDGFALGGGCELAMACDIRIATKRSQLGQPEVNLGIIPGAGGTQRLQRLVGIGKAKELIYTGDIISADEAKEIGLINKIVDTPEDLLKAAQEMAQKIIGKGPMAISLSKLSINLGANTDINTGLLFEKCAQTIAFSTEDRVEGTAAFLEKRKPNFKGK
jgi:enoyl-CoA hydratase